MKKVIIGILPTANLFKEDNYYDDYYKFINLYPKRLYECNAIPIGLLMNDGTVDYDSLDMCDGFLIPGGKAVEKYVYEIIYYAIKHNKPVLGICLGAQAIAIYSAILEKMDSNKEYTLEEIKEIYKSLKEEYDGSLLRLIPTPSIHKRGDLTRDNINEHMHKIKISKDSLLYDIFNTEEENVVSIHSYDFKHVGKDFTVTAYAEDGVNESVEYNDKNRFIFGVHFHPELLDDNRIIARLVKEAEIRK